MSTRSLTLLIVMILFVGPNLTDSHLSGTCDDPFTIFKHTLSTTDSARDCESAYSIFPEIADQGATKFHDGQCAHQCKLELPFSCFMLHAPQTQFEEGMLLVETLEHQMSEKWEHSMGSPLHIAYDPFFDFNIAFWVKSLDEYISHWQSDADTEGNHFEYFGVEWHFDIDGKQSWYSVMVHSPRSQINYEFVSFSKPKQYALLQWTSSPIPRCTFYGFPDDEYPWNREDAASIVPVRISRATTNTQQMHDFYADVLGAELLYHAEAEDGHHQDIKTVFMLLPGTHIELQFVQRPSGSTFGEFTLDVYEDLLAQTHRAVITSPYCGQDRWMDNHFGSGAYF